MSAKQPEIESLVARRYRHGFVTDIESDTVAARSRRRRHPAHLGEEGRARVHARLAAEGLPPLARMTEPHLGARALPADRLPGDLLLLGAEAADRRPEDRSTDVDPKLLETYDKLGIPLHERARLAGVAVDAVFDSVSVATTFKERLAEAGVIFCPFSEAVQKHPELIEQLPRHASCRSATTSTPRSIPRSSPTARSSTCRRACAARWSCRPTSASTPRRPASSSAR